MTSARPSGPILCHFCGKQIALSMGGPFDRQWIHLDTELPTCVNPTLTTQCDVVDCPAPDEPVDVDDDSGEKSHETCRGRRDDVESRRWQHLAPPSLPAGVSAADGYDRGHYKRESL